MNTEALRQGIAKELRICRGSTRDSIKSLAENTGIAKKRIRELELAEGDFPTLDELSRLCGSYGYASISEFLAQSENWAKSYPFITIGGDPREATDAEKKK